MASTLPPVKGAAFTFPIALVSQGDTDIFQTGVTITTADVWVSKDFGAFAAATAAPTELLTTPGGANTGVLSQGLTATEMTADVVTVLYHDAAGTQWQDALVTIYTAAQTLDTTDGVVDTISGKIIGTLATGTHTAQTGDTFLRLGAPAGASVSADIAAIAADVVTIDNSGIYSYSSTVDNGTGGALDGVFIQCSTNVGFTNVIGTTYSNALGAYTVRSDTAGTHYLRFQLAGYNFSDETVTLA